MMVNVMDFFNKNIRNYPLQTIFIYSREMAEWNMRGTLMLGNGTLEGIWNSYA
jgi:hypothetical protein